MSLLSRNLIQATVGKSRTSWAQRTIPLIQSQLGGTTSSQQYTQSASGPIMTSTTTASRRRFFSTNMWDDEDSDDDEPTTGSCFALILGKPGGGKGTISDKILKDFPHFQHVSTGDLLRSHVRQGTTLGTEANKYMSDGQLVPDHLMVELVMHEATPHLEQGKSLLLDGFPRTVEQAKYLSDHIDVHVVINLDVPNETIVERIADRWIHAESGRTYSYSYKPPEVEGVDDVTGEPLIQRPDDMPQTVRERLTQYNKRCETQRVPLQRMNSSFPMHQRKNTSGNSNGSSNNSNNMYSRNGNYSRVNNGDVERGGRFNDTNTNILEQQNNERIFELSEQVSRLKGLTIDIGNEVREQNSLLDQMGDGFSNTKDMLQNSLRHIGTMLESGGAKHMCYMVSFVVFVVVFLYWMMTFKK
eukprot:Nitzschia sp. Nitz4//scaffold162_size51285//7600//9536//NITZ4_006965-RA/size51285-processed-gene-0.42-mRNA-1//-1//CDS//3329537961//3678//frame0